MAGDEHAPSAELKDRGSVHVSVAPRNRSASGGVDKSGLTYSSLAPCELDIVLDHHLDQLCEGDLRLPAEDVERLGRISAHASTSVWA
jgi:hypothetical protein